LSGVLVAVDAAASGYTLTGPTHGVLGQDSANFVVTPNGTFGSSGSPAIVRIDFKGAGPVDPVVLTWFGSSVARTFTVNIDSIGQIEVSSVNNSGLTDPDPITHEVKASGYTISGPRAVIQGNTVTYTITPIIPLTGNITLTPNGGGLSPNVATFTNSTTPQYMAFVPSSSAAITLIPSNTCGTVDPPLWTLNIGTLTTINSGFLTTNAGTYGGPPYYLASANTYYQLATDVSVPGTALILAATNQTLDLNGHAVTFSETARAFADTWESETIGNAPSGWNVGSTGAKIAANTSYLWNGGTSFAVNCVEIDGLSVAIPVSIKYSNITIPTAGRQYAACVSCGVPGANSASVPAPQVTLTVLKHSDQSTLATGNTGGGYRSDGSTATWQDSGAAAVDLVITVNRNISGATSGIQLARVRVVPYADYGIVASKDAALAGKPDWPSGVQTGYTSMLTPAIIDTVGTGSISMSNNGTTTFGDGAFCCAIMCHDARNALAISDQNLTVGGMEGCGIDANGNNGSFQIGPRAIDNCSITYGNERDVNQRVSGSPALICLNSLDVAGATSITGCTLVNTPFQGIKVSKHNATYGAMISGNTITQKVVQTNGYAISLQAYNTCQGNTIGGDGRGILCDSLTTVVMQNITVDANTVSLTESGDREVGITSDVKCLRARTDSGGDYAGFNHFRVTNNTFTSQGTATSQKLVQAILGTFLDNPGYASTDLIFSNNTVKAYVTTTSVSWSVVCEDLGNFTATVLPNVYNDSITSNATASSIGTGPGGYDVLNVTLNGCDLIKSTDGDTTRTFIPLGIGYGTHSYTGHKALGCHVNVGSGLRAITTSDVTFYGTGSQDLTIGWRLTIVVYRAGAPVSGATVNVSDSGANIQSTGTTDSYGSVVLPCYTVKKAYGSSDTTYTPLSVSATDGTHSGSTSVAPTDDTILSLAIA